MSGSEAPAVLIGDRQLMEYTDRAKTTVRDWHQRPFNPLPYTINSKGYRVFKVSEVDEWLSSRRGNDGGNSDIGRIRYQLILERDKTRKLELQLSELKAAKVASEQAPVPAVTLTKVEQLTKVRDFVRTMVQSKKREIPGTTDIELTEADQYVYRFFRDIKKIMNTNPVPARNAVSEQPQ